MKLEIHDIDPTNSLAARVPVDYDYQAEQWVQDWATDERTKQVFALPIDKMVLVDDVGIRATWKRKENKFYLAEASERFTGTWKVGVEF